jgi:hypothetical protein
MSAKKTDSLAAGKIINNSCICRSDALREREREREGGRERERERERERIIMELEWKKDIYEREEAERGVGLLQHLMESKSSGLSCQMSSVICPYNCVLLLGSVKQA